MSGVELFGVICACGAVGGLGKAVFGGVGVVLPSRVASDQGQILRPGWVGTVLAGALAAGISWALYGPFADAVAIGNSKGAELLEYTASWAELAGAALVGYVGGQWLNSEADKKLAKAAAVKAAEKQPSKELANQIAEASPAEALKFAEAAE